MDPEIRLEFEGAILNKDRIIGSSVITLAKNFPEKGEQPFVSFGVYHDRIVLDCNEDGFTDGNLRAICSIGKSSKAGDHGYIGEKGIGFKSVFKVGWKSGMGMISPEWVPDGAIEGGLTRITITLHENGDGQDFATYAKQHENITKQLEDLKPAMILFLKNLERIEIHTFDTEDETEMETIVMTRAKGDIKYPETLETSTVTSIDEPKSIYSEHHFHVTKALATGLAPNENRNHVSQSSSQRKAASKAEIIMAFPLSDDSLPIIEPQELYAFLPIHHVGLSFFVHSDFVTMANREDVVETSQRNQDLIPHLAKTFVQAVKEMSGAEELLGYTWMRYLPSKSAFRSAGPYWDEVFNCIEQEILHAEVLLPSTASSSLRSIKQLRWCGEGWYDQHNEPLFEDLDEDPIYISPHYSQEDINLLKPYGLEEALVGSHLLSRVEADLERSVSKMKSPDTDNDRHSRASKLFMKAEPDMVKNLALFPLQSGEWVEFHLWSPGPLCLPFTEDNLLGPPGLDYRLIHVDAAKQPERRKLFEFAGAVTLNYEDLRLEVGTNTYIYDEQDKFGPAHFELDVQFLYGGYLQDPPTRSSYNDQKPLNWINWLHDYAGIRRQLELVVHKGDGEQFLNDLVVKVLSSRDMLKKLSHVQVLCEENRQLDLSETVIPAPSLKNIAAKVLEPTHTSVFLKLETEITDENIDSWKFLKNLGVICDDGLPFYLNLLEVMANEDLQQPLRILELYRVIHGKRIASDAIESSRELIRITVDDCCGIYIPGKEPSWCTLKDTCLLDAPADMEHKFPLDQF
ncbi:hypothetical protein QBC38DRAFT_459437 [Podospora fimiseda]|uniref:Uncharacterized protein n=1 Tax=Podospora fimiseda TaxID=252190 RepID=A0AAN7BHI2_9PEZI|nr:hypothetical protein QBC38DRAFT_459437 [Podospora fimiseda]